MSSSQTFEFDEYLANEYGKWQGYWESQTPIIQRFFEAQSGVIADALSRKYSQVKFTLPDQVVGKNGNNLRINADQREQSAGGVISQFTHANLASSVHARLDELEASQSEGSPRPPACSDLPQRCTWCVTSCRKGGYG